MHRQGRWAVVAGASSGIGRATALELADQGWNVVVHYARSQSSAQSVVDEVKSRGGEAVAMQADFANPQAGPEFVEAAWSQVGAVDAWIHIAGVDLLTGENAKLRFEEKLRLATAVDLWGTMLTCRAVGRKMFERGCGVVVTIGWDQAATGMEGDSGELFAAIKGGIAAFTRSLAKSLAPKVRAMCVAPGWIQTAWGETASEIWQQRVHRETPLQRWGRPEDVARSIAFVVSPQAEFLTAQTLNVNGGVVTT